MRPNNAYKWSDSLRRNKRIIHSKICSYDASFSSKSSLKISIKHTRTSLWRVMQRAKMSGKCVKERKMLLAFIRNAIGKLKKWMERWKGGGQIYPRVTLNLRHLWILIHPRNNSEEVLLVNRWKFRIEKTQSITRSLLPIVLK